MPTLQERLVYRQRSPLLGRYAAWRLRNLGISIPSAVRMGEGLQLPHGAVGLVVHEATVIGAACRLYQGVTLGRADVHLPTDRCSAGGGIVLGDRVLIGANAVVLFRSGSSLVIGDDAVIGANSLVTTSVPAGEVWAGNPARCVSHR